MSVALLGAEVTAIDHPTTRKEERMQGTMLWFNVDKGYGFIQTEKDERLYVARSGFLPNHEPRQRCKGRGVSFERRVREGDTRAVGVSFVRDEHPPRARRRMPQGGHAIA